MKSVSRSWSPATSSPPSVVRSSRFSGTRQTACGRWRRAMACISAVAAHSKFSGTVSAAISASISASRMWRRSSRRWAVMPSAPAASASRAARSGSGQARPAGVAHGGHMVDVHAKPQLPGRCSCVVLPLPCLSDQSGRTRRVVLARRRHRRVLQLAAASASLRASARRFSTRSCELGGAGLLIGRRPAGS